VVASASCPGAPGITEPALGRPTDQDSSPPTTRTGAGLTYVNAPPPSRRDSGQAQLGLQPHHGITWLNPPISSPVGCPVGPGSATGDALPYPLRGLCGSIPAGQCPADRSGEGVFLEAVRHPQNLTSNPPGSPLARPANARQSLTPCTYPCYNPVGRTRARQGASDLLEEDTTTVKPVLADRAAVTAVQWSVQPKPGGRALPGLHLSTALKPRTEPTPLLSRLRRRGAFPLERTRGSPTPFGLPLIARSGSYQPPSGHPSRCLVRLVGQAKSTLSTSHTHRAAVESCS